MVDSVIDPILDYRYAWRWLLPISDVQPIALIGFSKEEQSFWEQAFPNAIISDNPESAQVWLVQDMLPRHQPLPDNLQTICVIGKRSVIASWRKCLAGQWVSVQGYGLLPAGQPRVVIPLCASSVTRHGLVLHRPGRRLARLAVWIAGQLTRLGWDAPLSQRSLCIATRTGPLIPNGAIEAGLEVDGYATPTAFALCLGNPEPNRKTVVLPLCSSEQIILKIGGTLEAQEALLQEVVALQALNRSPLSRQVPCVLKVVDSGRQITLHQEYRPRLAASEEQINSEAVCFLAGLSQLGRETRPLATFLETLTEPNQKMFRPVAGRAYARVHAMLKKMSVEGAMVVGHRSHGDFAPWNCSWTAKGFFVYDWESSQAWDMALADAFYFMFSPFIYVKNSASVDQVYRRTMLTASVLVEDAGLKGVDIEGYFLLWLIRSVAVYPELCNVLEYISGLSDSSS